MPYDPLLVCLPIADRVRSHAFYRDALGLEAVGDLADDGVPEPLQFDLNPMTRLMLVPTGGFGWAVAPAPVAPPGTVGCLLSLPAPDDAAVDALVARARAAGAVVTSAPARQPWGYEGAFADPDGHLWSVTSAAAPG